MRLFKNRKTKRRNLQGEISPEDIFIDSKNKAVFDENQLEGWLEKPISKKTINWSMVIFLILILTFGWRLFDLQVLEGKAYAERSSENRLRKEVVFANRGIIEDRNGKVLSWNEHSGSSTEAFPQRKYIKTPGFSHLLGYVTAPQKDSSGNYYETYYQGKAGLEDFYDERLSGTNGEILIEEDAHQNPHSSSVVRQPQDGRSLSLSIDARLQEKLYEAIDGLAHQAGFVGGAGAVIDIHTGEVLALVSYPEFDSQVMSLGKDTKAISEMLSNPANMFLNRAVAGLYTPGSTVKPFVALGALNENLISPSKKLLSTGALVVPNPFFPDQPSVFRDWKAHGWVDMREALAHSSNEYFFKVGGGFESQRGLGIDKLSEYVKSFGLDEQTGIDLYGEATGLVPDPEWKEEIFGEDWRLGDTYNTSIGQYGFQITPLELVRATAAIANGGYLVRPHIALDVDTKTKEIPFVDESELQVVREGMRKGVLEGTASSLNVSYVEVAAKTGTAELGVTKSTVNSWVSGFFPYKEPKYAFVVVMEKASRENIYGAVLAARAFLDGVQAEAPEYLTLEP